MLKNILITGATGNISSGVINHLKSSKHHLLALVRNPEKPKAKELERAGAELRVGDLDKPWTLSNAFKGAEIAWILTPPGPRAPEQSSNAVWAAMQAGVKYIVRMSAIGAGHNAPTINSRLHGLSDAELIASEIPYTIIKPHFFMQNLLGSAQLIAETGTLNFPLADSRMGLIDSRDIAEFAACVLANPDGHEGKIYTITGPESLSMNQVTETIGNSIHKKVAYKPATIDDTWKTMVSFGMDEWSVNLLCDYFRAYSTNWGNLVTNDFKDVVGKPARSITDFGRDFSAAFVHH